MENNFEPKPKDPNKEEHNKTLVNGKWRNTRELTISEDGTITEPKIYEEDQERYNELEVGYEVTYKNQTNGKIEEGVVVKKDDETYKVFIGPKGMDEHTQYGVAVAFDDIYMVRKPKDSKE